MSGHWSENFKDDLKDTELSENVYVTWKAVRVSDMSGHWSVVRRPQTCHEGH